MFGVNPQGNLKTSIEKIELTSYKSCLQAAGKMEDSFITEDGTEFYVKPVCVRNTKNEGTE